MSFVGISLIQRLYYSQNCIERVAVWEDGRRGSQLEIEIGRTRAQRVLLLKQQHQSSLTDVRQTWSHQPQSHITHLTQSQDLTDEYV